MHVRELGMQNASDEEIFDRAGQDGRIVVSADTDFGTSSRTQAGHAVGVLFRHGTHHRPADQAMLLKANLPQLAAALDAGSITAVAPDRIRIRRLPLIP